MKVLALVIGNDNYFDPDKLNNAVNDAKAMEDVFNRLGYSIISGYDCKSDDYDRLLSEFEKLIKEYDATIFFYAGHGFQEDGENFLPSIECQISYANKYELKRDSLELSDLLKIYSRNNRKTHIAILDACRMKTNNRGGTDSFAPVDAPPGTLIAFSTSPNSSAKDSIGGNHSVYTEALLTYIGRENLSVEDLFKKVRRTVVSWTKNTQIPWEHTSLISDFCFNVGQMIASPQIPYRKDVVHDAEYEEVGEIADLINEIRIPDYNRQNPAINKILLKSSSELDRNQQFIFGRNLLQASSMAFSAQHFMNSLATYLRKYNNDNGENHVLNGILFEIYFDSHANCRMGKIKDYFFEEVMHLRTKIEFSKSFAFIRTLISSYKEDVIYQIPEDNAKLDVTITARNDTYYDSWGFSRNASIISSIVVEDKNITKTVKYNFEYKNLKLKEAIAKSACAPKDAIAIHSNIQLSDEIAFEEDNM